MTRIHTLVATFLFIGRLSPFPGTLASFISMGLFFIVFSQLQEFWMVQLIIVLCICFVGVVSSKEYSKYKNEHDPSDCVIDEVAGMGIAILFLPSSLLCYIISFILFRILDILKPSFIYHVQALGNGWGIMLDDMVAGVISLIIVYGMNPSGAIY